MQFLTQHTYNAVIEVVHCYLLDERVTALHILKDVVLEDGATRHQRLYEVRQREVDDRRVTVPCEFFWIHEHAAARGVIQRRWDETREWHCAHFERSEFHVADTVTETTEDVANLKRLNHHWLVSHMAAERE